MNYLIGIDAGTSALKSVLFDETGCVLSSAYLEYPMDHPQNGWAQQDPKDWKNAMFTTLQQIIQNSGVEKEDIKGIGLSGQMHGIVLLDEKHEVLRPSIIWCDQRTKEEVQDMETLMPREEWIRITGNPPLTGWSATKILWVKKQEPVIFHKTKHILLPKDYLRFCLTGGFASDVSDASGMQLMDIKHRCWSKIVLEKLDIKEELLPDLYESVEVTGTLLPEIANSLGLSVHTKVIAGAGDNAAAAIGTGVVQEGKAFTTIGTSGVVFAHCDHMAVDPKGRIHTCCAAVPNTWHVMGVTQAAGLSLQWFKKQCCSEEIMLAQQQQKDVYDVMNEAVRDIMPGSDQLIYLPYLMGERTPHLDPDCRGVFFGLSAFHTRAHMIHAVMEGVAYSLADCNDILHELNIHIDEMMACGGGGKSPVWRQMMADLYQCHVMTQSQSEGPAFGAAILAGVGCGIYESVENACADLIQTNQMTAPIKEHSKIYQDYHALYQSLYRTLKDSFTQLAQIDKEL